jgi:hypothetical protein
MTHTQSLSLSPKRHKYTIERDAKLFFVHIFHISERSLRDAKVFREVIHHVTYYFRLRGVISMSFVELDQLREVREREKHVL